MLNLCVIECLVSGSLTRFGNELVSKLPPTCCSLALSGTGNVMLFKPLMGREALLPRRYHISRPLLKGFALPFRVMSATDAFSDGRAIRSHDRLVVPCKPLGVTGAYAVAPHADTPCCIYATSTAMGAVVAPSLHRNLTGQEARITFASQECGATTGHKKSGSVMR